MNQVSRRTLAKGATWTVPAIAVATVAPALAASACNPVTAQQDVETYFQSYLAGLPDATGVNLVASFHQPTGTNGALAEAAMYFHNTGTTSLTGAFPLDIQFAFRNVSTSAAVNTTLTSYRGPIAASRTEINKPWAAEGGNQTSTNAVYVGQCSTDQRAVRRRDLSWGSSYIDVYSPSTARLLKKATFAEMGEEHAECIEGAPGAYGWTLAVRKEIPAGKTLNVMAAHLRDGIAPGGRIYVGMGVRIRGFRPPSYEDFLADVLVKYPGSTSEDLDPCYFTAYSKRLTQWYEKDEGLRGMTFQAAGWSYFYGNDAVDARGWTRSVSSDDWVWSDEIGSFMREGDEGSNNRIHFSGWTADAVQTSSALNSRNEIMWRDGIY